MDAIWPAGLHQLLWQIHYIYFQNIGLFPATCFFSILTRMDTNSIKVKVKIPTFPILLPTDKLFILDNTTEWRSLTTGLELAVTGPTILFNHYTLPTDNYTAVIIGIIQGMSIIVSDNFSILVCL